MWVKRLGAALLAGYIVVAFAPIVSANSAMPFMAQWYGFYWHYCMVPVIIVEFFVAWLYFTRFKNSGLRFWHNAIISLTANIASYLIGAVILTAATRHVEPSSYWLLAAFLMSFIVEAIVIYFFVFHKIDKPVIRSILLSLMMNVISYLLIIVLAITGSLGN